MTRSGRGLGLHDSGRIRPNHFHNVVVEGIHARAAAVDLLQCPSGSICLVDAASHSYRKEIDLDEGCQTGQVFPFDEGVTGALARAGRPVIFEHNSDVAHGRIRPDGDRFGRRVIGVPTMLKSELVGAVMVFVGE